MNKTIKPTQFLRGEISLPGDKSISHRTVFIGGISFGKTTGKNFLEAEDCLSTVYAFREMGIDIEIRDKTIHISGKGLRGLRAPAKELYLGNSGTTMRILPGIIAGQSFKTTLTGDESLSKRPMKRIIEPLRGMGIDIKSASDDGLPPLIIKGGSVKPIEYSTNVASAQVKSCILFAGLYAKGKTGVTEPLLSRDHTERMLGFFGAKISKNNRTVFVEGEGRLRGKEIFIPGDISSAAFFIAGAALLEGSDITIRDVGLNPTRTGFLNALLKMGADIKIQKNKEILEPCGDIRIKGSGLKAITVEKAEIPFLIDEVPILACLACFAEGKTIIKGISELRVKETDRVASMIRNLKSMGADIKDEGENLVIAGGKKRLKSARLLSFKDHRTAMTMAIAALTADGECIIEEADCVNTSFPNFFELVDYLRK